MSVFTRNYSHVMNSYYTLFLSFISDIHFAQNKRVLSHVLLYHNYRILLHTLGLKTYEYKKESITNNISLNVTDSFLIIFKGYFP